MVRWGLAALAVLALMGTARGDNLADARKAVESSDYDAARTALEKALADGTQGPDDLADLYRMKGIVDAAEGNTAAATTSFGKWLALDPKAALPAGTSPKITRPFDAAKTQAKGREPVKVKTETTSDPPTVTLEVQSDPFMMISTVRVHVRADGGKSKTVEGKKKLPIDLPKGKRLDLYVEALDDNGNRVAVLGSPEVPIVITGAGGHEEVVVTKPEDKAKPLPPPPPPETHEVHERPLYLKWWMWTGVAVAIGAGGAYFGMQARSETDQLNKLNADSQDHTFDEAKAVESDARRDILLFNVSMGVAGAFAIGAAVLYLTEPHAETHVAAVPTNGGGAVVLGGHF
jgi:hypothetical protein